MNRQFMGWLFSAAILMVSPGLADTIFNESGGLVVMEMESTDSPLGNWYLIEKNAEGYPQDARGKGHLEFGGGGKWDVPHSPLVYTFKINTPGRYALRFRAHKRLEGNPGDKNNDAFVRMEGDFGPGSTDLPLKALQRDVKLYGGAADSWGVARTLDINFKKLGLGKGHKKKPAVYEFKAGEVYTFVISGRSVRYNLDRMVFSHEDVEVSMEQLGTLPESERIAASQKKNPVSKTPAGPKLVYSAVSDFPKTDAGEVPYYVHKGKKALGINAGNPAFRNKFARAEAQFSAVGGRYDVTLTALRELDGECTYRFLVNGRTAGSVQNGTTDVDYAPQKHLFRNIHIPAGVTIAVESDCATNGKIPEGDSTAYARGRWTSLSFAPAAAAVAKVGKAGVKVSGDLNIWHKVSLSINGPTTSESATPNPFTGYRVDVTFTHSASGATYVVPAFYAADGDAANSGAVEGSQWRCHFRPDRAGEWHYIISFRQGNNVAMGDRSVGSATAPFDGIKGSFDISADNPAVAPDLRARGRLQYVGKHHLQFAGDSRYFLKFGPDSPENFLEYDEFDNTPEKGNKGIRHTFEAHAKHYKGEGELWGDGKGKNIYGALNYISSTGANSISLLLNNIGRLVPDPNNEKRPKSGPGDGDRVFPYTGKEERLRFDCSKLAQWEMVFNHAEKKGLHLHFKMMEIENARDLDGGQLGPERKLYYREMVARFGHFLALNWNMSEEIPVGASTRTEWLKYMEKIDPWQNHRVFHTGPSKDKSKFYDPHLGDPELTGISLQTPEAIDTENVFNETKLWLNRSAAADHPWVVACDEQGPGHLGVNRSFERSRKNVLWGNIMAGGAGVEYYSGGSDLNLDDYAHFDQLLRWSDIAVNGFFYGNKIPFWTMSNKDELLAAAQGHCLTDGSNVFVIYLNEGGTASVDLGANGGLYDVRWYDPRHGGELLSSDVTSVSGGAVVPLGHPPFEPDQDWVILVRAR